MSKKKRSKKEKFSTRDEKSNATHRKIAKSKKQLNNQRKTKTKKKTSKKALVAKQHHINKKREKLAAVQVNEIGTEPCIDLYDENLLERARTQWQFGDWESLVKLDSETLEQHPDRAKLALLAAAGHLQRSDSSKARQFMQLAQNWGCSKKLISQILIAGIYNSLGRAAVVIGQQQRASKHFESAVAIGMPGSETRLLTQARMGRQVEELELAIQPETSKQNLLIPAPTFSNKAYPANEQKEEDDNVTFDPTANARCKEDV